MALTLKLKGGGEYRVIGLVDVVWKMVTVIINHYLIMAIQFHGVLNEFWAGHGTGTASLEAKLLQHLITTREEVLHMIFPDLYKTYYALDMDICLETLEGYGLEQRSHSLLHTYWYCITMVACTGG